MIYTVTFNPSLDYIVSVDDFMLGRVNRTRAEIIYPGGKGINVSMVLKNLGHDSHALGFMAGFTGQEIVRLLDEWGVQSDFIRVEQGISRINVKLRSNEESEINGQGPAIAEEHIRQLYQQLDRLEDGDVLVLAGSIPDVMPDDIYMDIMKHLSSKKLHIIVDATRDLLVNVLPYHPFLIKPNNHELGEVFGVELEDKEEVFTYAAKLQERGARNVLVSMAGDGALLVAEDGHIYKEGVCRGTVKNSVGAGDSMVAGFLAGYLEKGCSWITLFIAMAPSLGFLGTVIGMVQAFDKIQQVGDISPTVVAGGMKVALITTIFGLIVALILQVFYNYILSKIEALTSEMEDSSISLLDMVIKYDLKYKK